MRVNACLLVSSGIALLINLPNFFLIFRDPGAVSWVRKNGNKSFHEQVREPLGYYC